MLASCVTKSTRAPRERAFRPSFEVEALLLAERPSCRLAVRQRADDDRANPFHRSRYHGGTEEGLRGPLQCVGTEFVPGAGVSSWTSARTTSPATADEARGRDRALEAGAIVSVPMAAVVLLPHHLHCVRNVSARAA